MVILTYIKEKFLSKLKVWFFVLVVLYCVQLIIDKTLLSFNKKAMTPT